RPASGGRVTTADEQLTGRISAPPSVLLHDQVLAPQFAVEVRHLLRFYLHIEKVLLLEYQRMALMTTDEVQRTARLLHEVTADELAADPVANMSDIAFAIERHVTGR